MHPRARSIIFRACIAATITTASAAATALAIPAFPGAEGFGANALGGRGGDVYHVTSLADTLTPGTLRYGLRESGFPAAGRTIVFDVGGVINLNTNATLDIKNISKVTIAGQTAPTPITIINDTIQITGSNNKNTNDIIMRYLNVRKGTGNGDDAISIKGSPGVGFTTNNIILDHISGSWSEDEVISVTQRASNVSVQYSMMSEALTSNHAYGSLVRPMVNSNVSYSHNLYSNQKSRNPRPGTYDGMKLNFEFNNNVVYNWSDRAGYAGGSSEGDTEYVDMNYIGNYLVAGPSTPAGSKRTTAFTRDASDSPIVVHMYQSGNLIDSNTDTLRNGTNTDWGMFSNWDGTTTTAWPTNTVDDQDLRRSSAFSFSGMATDSAQDAYAKVISSVGAFPYARNAIDQRLIGNVLNYTGTAPITAPDVNEWSNLLATPTTTRPAGWDTDNDGMPNYWESLRGTNPAVADNNGFLSGDGYTNLENYINSLTFIANWNFAGDGNWSNLLNWRGTLPSDAAQGRLATANFISGNAAPTSITLDQAVTLSDLNFDSAVSYTLANGGQTLTMDAVTGKSTISVITGSHTISTPVALADDTIVTVSQPDSTLNFTNSVAATGRSIIKEGAGVAQFINVRSGGLVINQGAVRVATDGGASGASKVQTLSIAGGTTHSATLDLSDNDLIVGTGTPRAMIESQIAFARHGGAWDRPGITSSAALLDPEHVTTLGVLSGSEYTSVGGDGTFNSLSYASSETLVKYTYYGDTDFNGKVDGADYARIDSAYNNQSSQGNISGWLNGDLDFNGKVDGSDYALIDSAFNSQGGTLRQMLSFLDGSDPDRSAMTAPGLAQVLKHYDQFGESYAAAALANVPEPVAAVSTLLLGAGLATTRRRKRVTA